MNGFFLNPLSILLHLGVLLPFRNGCRSFVSGRGDWPLPSTLSNNLGAAIPGKLCGSYCSVLQNQQIPTISNAYSVMHFWAFMLQKCTHLLIHNLRPLVVTKLSRHLYSAQVHFCRAKRPAQVFNTANPPLILQRKSMPCGGQEMQIKVRETWARSISSGKWEKGRTNEKKEEKHNMACRRASCLP